MSEAREGPEGEGMNETYLPMKSLLFGPEAPGCLPSFPALLLWVVRSGLPAAVVNLQTSLPEDALSAFQGHSQAVAAFSTVLYLIRPDE